MSKKELVILLLGIAGVIVSWAKFIAWTSANGLDPFGGASEALAASEFGAGLIWDLSFSAIILLVVAVWDRARLGMKWMLGIIAATAVLGVCLGLPLYLIGARRGAA